MNNREIDQMQGNLLFENENSPNCDSDLSANIQGCNHDDFCQLNQSADQWQAYSKCEDASCPWWPSFCTGDACQSPPPTTCADLENNLRWLPGLCYIFDNDKNNFNNNNDTTHQGV